MAASSKTLDAVFSGLANRRRRMIVSRLVHGPVQTPDVGRAFGLTRQAMNRHLQLLERAGLVSRTMRGRVHELSLRTDRLDAVVHWVDELRRGWTENLARLDEVLRDEAN